MRLVRNRSAAVFLCLILAACGGDDEIVPDAAGPNPDAPATPDAMPPDPAVRGKYLVEAVANCGDCHTPRNTDGSFDMSRWLAGVECLFDAIPMDPNAGCINSRNLTNHATGLANRTDTEIKTMLRDGMRPNGAALSPVMPYWMYHNMSDDDADAIVAYLRTVTGVDHSVPPSQPPFDSTPAPAAPINMADVENPDPNDAELVRGRYLASTLAACIDCHTPEPEGTPPQPPFDNTKLYAGGRSFFLGIMSIDPVMTQNLTTLDTNRYTVDAIKTILKNGTDPDGAGVCPPMPVGPMGGFGGLTDEDATAIARYIVALTDITNDVPAMCTWPPM